MLRFFPSVFQRRVCVCVCVGGEFYLKLCNNQRGVLLREEKYNTREQRGVGGSGGSGRERETFLGVTTYSKFVRQSPA